MADEMIMVSISGEQLAADNTEAFDVTIPLGLCPKDKVEEFASSVAVQDKFKNLYAWKKELKFETYIRSADGVYVSPCMQ